MMRQVIPLTDPLEPRLVLGDVRVAPERRRTFTSRNPANAGDVISVLPSATGDDVRRAVAAAVGALGTWRRRSSIDRGQLLFAAAGGLEARAGEAAALIVREVGKSRPEAAGEVARGVDILRYFAGLGSAAAGEVLPSRAPDSFIYTRREPIGPVAVITPWNFPLAIPLWKIAPALVYGNTVVFKPAEESSAVGWLLTEVLLAAGVPGGVLNVLFGDGPTIGSALFDGPGIKGVTFTGSTGAGRAVEATAASGRGVKVQLELGGNNALIVLDDADLDLACELAVGAATKYAGQKCTATSRVIATSAVTAPLRDRIVARVAALRVGDPGTDDRIDVGPVIGADAERGVLAAVDRAVKEGASLLIGGVKATGGGRDDGHFVEPAVFERVPADSVLLTEEVFGPVIALQEAKDLDDAIRLANAGDFGLAAAVVTDDLGAALRCARELDVGIVKLNSESAGLEPHVPFGGTKDSGSHFKEQGTAAREFFTKLKTIYVQPGRTV
jgi:alpha-ketoglutaric semialdehyde dehydrogenase